MAYGVPDHRSQKRGCQGIAKAAFLACACIGAAHTYAASQSLTPSDDTFVNSRLPTNNAGGGTSIYTGNDGQGGIMRGLIRFAMPATLAGRVIVTNSALTMTTRTFEDASLTIAGTVSLRAITEAWTQGTGAGGFTGFTDSGQPCVSGASWNEPNCATATNWGTGGGSVAGLVSGSASVPFSAGTLVTWNAPGMNVDVQNWIDTSPSNHGWQLSSSTESTSFSAQAFYSVESGVSIPGLAITYNCKAAFLAVGTGCTTCTAAANGSCAVAQGNSCVDSGPPSTTYSCGCSSPLYTLGTTGGGSAACIPVTLDIDSSNTATKYDALTDGLLAIRHMSGLSGTSLTTGALGGTATRTDPIALKAYLDANRLAYDIDGDGNVDPLTDGLLILRYLFGLRGASLIQGAFVPTAPRNTSGLIETYLGKLTP